MRRTRVLAGAALALSLVGAARAHADTGHDCFRRSALCWDCVEVALPAFFPCSNPSACSSSQICIDQADGGPCLDPERRCCASLPCEHPPGCAAASASCIAFGDGGNQICTFPEACPSIDAGIDGGDSGALDASDASPLDASEDAADDATPDAEVEDAEVIDSTIIDSTVPEPDATIEPVPHGPDNPSGPHPSPGPDIPVIPPDAGRDASTPVSLNGDTIDDTNSTLTGCTCRVGPTHAPVSAIGFSAATLLAWLGRRRRRRH